MVIFSYAIVSVKEFQRIGTYYSNKCNTFLNLNRNLMLSTGLMANLSIEIHLEPTLLVTRHFVFYFDIVLF